MTEAGYRRLINEAIAIYERPLSQIDPVRFLAVIRTIRNHPSFVMAGTAQLVFRRLVQRYQEALDYQKSGGGKKKKTGRRVVKKRK